MISSVLNQTALYFAPPTPDGTGGWSYDTPVEIPCRWENKMKVIQSATGEMITCVSQVYTTDTIVQRGAMVLMDLDDFESGDTPVSLGARSIVTLESSPSLVAGGITLYKAYLGL